MHKKIKLILDEAVVIGRSYMRDGLIDYSSNYEQNEDFLVLLLKQAAETCGCDPNIIKHLKGHSFPDVIVEGSSIGIELKGSKSSKKFNGNSISGMALPKNVKLNKIYLFYWINDDKILDYRDYFDCVDEPVVTHSPRFKLDPFLPSDKSMFGYGIDKVGSVSEIIFSNNGIQTDKIVLWMRERAKRKGEECWWVDNDNTNTTGITVGMRGLNEQIKKEILFLGYLYFPEILDSKFSRFIAWAISIYGVVLNRDFFTAGGEVAAPIKDFHNITFSRNLDKFFKVMCDFYENITISLKDLNFAGDLNFSYKNDFIEYYINEISNKINKHIKVNNFKNLSTTEQMNIDLKLKTYISHMLEHIQNNLYFMRFI